MSKNKKEVLQEVATPVVSAGFRKTLSDRYQICHDCLYFTLWSKG